jgi:hypothetical protein
MLQGVRHEIHDTNDSSQRKCPQLSKYKKIPRKTIPPT